jgi:1-phosphofructokinase family hexose kinase
LIVTLTMNPAIDRMIAVDRLAFDDRAYILSSQDSPGGRGINAASVIHSFGGRTLAIFPAGGDRGARFEHYMRDCGFPVATVPIANDIRLNFTIVDRHGLTVKLNELGPRLERGELASVEGTVEAQLASASWLMLCGSLPPGVPNDFYAQLIARAKKKGVRTLLDTDGDALSRGVEAGPTVVTPNQQEAERLLNTVLLTRAHSLAAARRIQSMGAESVVLSLGSRGAIGAVHWQGADQLWEAAPPRVEAISPIGAGDALAAALTWSLRNGDDFPEALSWGVAAGSASAQLPGTRFATFDQTAEIHGDVDLRRVEGP